MVRQGNQICVGIFLAKKFKTHHGWGVDDYFLEQLLSLCLFLL